MTRNSVSELGCDERLFRTVVKTSFGQRRKTLRNSIRGLIPSGVPLPEDPLMALRPEQLSVEEFVTLTNLVSSLRNNQA